MNEGWEPVWAAGGEVRVWLPAGERLEPVGGLEYWSPDPVQGRFTVAERTDDPLAAERAAGGEVAVERDESGERGGFEVRRLRYRVRVLEPRVVLEGPKYVGGTLAEHVTDVLLINGGGGALQVGYTVRADAERSVGATFAEVLDRVRIGSET